MSTRILFPSGWWLLPSAFLGACIWALMVRALLGLL